MTNPKRMRTADHTDTATKLLVSNCDTRQYKLINLPNGIEALLVRIPAGQSSKAAISVAVKAGSMDEPDAFGGLAHFVEHCIFLGNDKYPTRNSLDKLLAKHNGYSNAHTELEYTAFYLEVNREGLSKAADIFSSAFVSPSFDVEMSCAELEAVDSEFHEIVNNDDCRIEQIICSLASSNHKYKKFTWGNHSSLMKSGGPVLVNAAKQFFDEYYSCNRMKICMVSSYSFDKMEKLLDGFSQIPQRGLDAVSSSAALTGMPFPIAVESLPMTLSMIPIAEIHQLIILFQLPPVFEYYARKPTDYLAHLIGHEAEGSLIASLRKADLASELSAGIGGEGYYSNSGMSMFEIKLTLTKRGLAEWKRIPGEFVFPYIERVKQAGVTEQVYSELREIALVQFNNATEEFTKEPIDTAEDLSILLLDHFKIDRSHLLIHDFLYDPASLPFDSKPIEHCLSYMSADKSIVLIVSPDAGPTNLTDPIFGISYGKSDACVDWSVSPTMVQDFIVPPLPNKYVPKQADRILAVQSGTDFVEPTEIVVHENLKMYCFSSVRSQRSSKTDIRIRLNLSAVEGQSVIDQFVSTHLLAAYLTDLLEPKLYCAKLAGYSISIAAIPPCKGNSSVGIEICVNGFMEHMHEVVGSILEQVNAGSGDAPLGVDEERLARVFDLIRRSYANEELHPVSTQAVNIRKVFLSNVSFFRAKDKLTVLQGLDSVRAVSEVRAIHTVDALVIGSYNSDLKEQIKNLLLAKMESPAPTTGDSEFPCVQKLASETLIVEPTLNPNEPTSCLVMYYQIADEFSVENSALADVLSDLMSEPFFDCLRTEEQLGYSVQCGCRYTNGSIGLEFMIQSSCQTPEAMVSLVEQFIASFYEQHVDILSDDEFDDQMNALVESLTETPASLAREAKDLWTEVMERRLIWDLNPLTRKEIEAKFVGNKEAVKSAIEQHLVKNKRVVVHVNGQGKTRQ